MIRSFADAHPRRRFWVLVALAVLSTSVFVASRVAPAGAYTIEHVDDDTILVTSARLHATHVRATMYIRLHRDGRWEWWGEIHNAASVRHAEYFIRGKIKFATIYYTLVLGSGWRSIEDEDYDSIGPSMYTGTPNGTSPEVRDHWDDLRAGFQADFYLKANMLV